MIKTHLYNRKGELLMIKITGPHEFSGCLGYYEKWKTIKTIEYNPDQDVIELDWGWRTTFRDINSESRERVYWITVSRKIDKEWVEIMDEWFYFKSEAKYFMALLSPTEFVNVSNCSQETLTRLNREFARTGNVIGIKCVNDAVNAYIKIEEYNSKKQLAGVN